MTLFFFISHKKTSGAAGDCGQERSGPLADLSTGVGRLLSEYLEGLVIGWGYKVCALRGYKVCVDNLCKPAFSLGGGGGGKEWGGEK